MYRFLILTSVALAFLLNTVKPVNAQLANPPYMQQVYHGGQSFSDALPWGQHFPYGISNIQRPRDNAYHVTVVYSTKGIRSEQDQYLYAWFRKHPALSSLKRQTNFYETHITDPAYQSYLRASLPVVPAILITKPPAPGGGYFGEVVYCAYGQYLSSDPNIIAAEIQAALHTSFPPQPYHPQASQAPWQPYHPQRPPLPYHPVQYQPVQYQPPQPYYPPGTYHPQQYHPQQYPQALPPVIPDIGALNKSQSMMKDPMLLFLALGGIVVLYVVLSGRKGSRRR